MRSSLTRRIRSRQQMQFKMSLAFVLAAFASGCGTTPVHRQVVLFEISDEVLQRLGRSLGLKVEAEGMGEFLMSNKKYQIFARIPEDEYGPHSDDYAGIDPSKEEAFNLYYYFTRHFSKNLANQWDCGLSFDGNSPLWERMTTVNSGPLGQRLQLNLLVHHGVTFETLKANTQRFLFEVDQFNLFMEGKNSRPGE